MRIDKAIKTSRTLQFGFKARELKQQGKDIISLGLGEPEFDTPTHIKKAASEALDAGMTRYSSAPGLPELRELIAQQLHDNNGIAADSEEIIVTPGAKNALFVACASTLEPGDEVINFTPCYVSNIPILKLAEPKVVIHNVPLTGDEFAIDQEKIESLINEKTKLIMINYPNNPTGLSISAEQANFIHHIVRDNDLYLLSDEIYERIMFGGKRHISLASFDDIREKVITVNGFSKAYSMTGWRIGYVHANSDLVSVMLKVHQHLNTNTPAFIQQAAVAAIKGPQDHIGEFIKNLEERKVLYEEMLSANDYLSGSRPQGGFFAFLNISRTGFTSDEFCTKLIENTGVVCIPGISFGEDFDHYCRVSLVNYTPIVAEGLQRISSFVDQIGRA